jgi:hypothetical protein
MYRELDFENVHDLTNGHEAIKYAQRSFMERFFKLIPSENAESMQITGKSFLISPYGDAILK